jgi:hypothetical protein
MMTVIAFILWGALCFLAGVAYCAYVYERDNV